MQYWAADILWKDVYLAIRTLKMVFSSHKIHALFRLQLETGYYKACNTLRASCAVCTVHCWFVRHWQSNEIGWTKKWKIYAHIIANMNMLMHNNMRRGKQRVVNVATLWKRGKEGNSTLQKPLQVIMLGRDIQIHDGIVVWFSHNFSRNSFVMMRLLMYSKRRT